AQQLRGYASRTQPGDLPRHRDGLEVAANPRRRAGAERSLERLAAAERDRDRRADARVALQVGLLDAVDRGDAAGIPGGIECQPQPRAHRVAGVRLQRGHRRLLVGGGARVEGVVLSEEPAPAIGLQRPPAGGYRYAELRLERPAVRSKVDEARGAVAPGGRDDAQAGAENRTAPRRSEFTRAHRPS